jgi:hypothetical protein
LYCFISGLFAVRNLNFKLFYKKSNLEYLICGFMSLQLVIIAKGLRPLIPRVRYWCILLTQVQWLYRILPISSEDSMVNTPETSFKEDDYGN